MFPRKRSVEQLEEFARSERINRREGGREEGREGGRSGQHARTARTHGTQGTQGRHKRKIRTRSGVLLPDGAPDAAEEGGTASLAAPEDRVAARDYGHVAALPRPLGPQVEAALAPEVVLATAAARAVRVVGVHSDHPLPLALGREEGREADLHRHMGVGESRK